MTSRPRALPACRHLLAAPIAVVVLLAAAACGSDDTSAEPAPESGSPTTASSPPTPTPTASETPTTVPLSPYENDPAVKVLREWAVVLGKGVPKSDLGGLRKVAKGQGLTSSVEGFEADYGNEWPGPQPLTPVRVTRSGTTAEVVFCMQSRGWSLDPKTHAPISSKREVVAAQSSFVKTERGWMLTTFYSSDFDCSQIPVKGVAW